MIAARITVVDSDAARHDAQHILSDRRYKPASAPRPFRGLLQWLGDRLSAVFGWIGDHLGLSGASEVVVLVAIAAVVVALALLRAQRVRRDRKAAAGARAPGEPAAAADDADALERAADAAERAGDHERAVRLRFRAGLLRLGAGGSIRYRPSVTTGEVRRALASRRFDDLAETFEEVAYGGREAAASDADDARREWPHVLDEAGRR